VAVDPITFTAAARYVYGAFTALSGGRLSAADRAAIDAAGVRPFRGVFRGAGGLVLSQAQAIQRGNTILAAQRPVALPTPPAPTGPTYQTPEGLLREVFERNPNYTPGRSVPVPGNPDFEDLLRRPSPDIGTRTPTTWNPESPTRTLPRAGPVSAVSVLARAAGLLGGLLYPTPTADSDLGYESRSDRGEAPPDLRRGARRRPRLRRRPEPQPEPLGQTTADRLPRPSARPVSTSLPQSGPQRVPIGTPLPSPFPIPSPAPSATAAPRPVAFPSPLPFLLPLPRPSVPRPGRTPDTMSPLVPGGSTASPNRSPRFDRQPRPLTQPLPQPLASPTGGSSDPCKCTRSSKPKRKRKPRSVCYRGSFTETRASTLKVRKEQIPCR